MLPRSMLISPIMAVTSSYRQVLDYELLEAVVCKEDEYFLFIWDEDMLMRPQAVQA